MMGSAERFLTTASLALALTAAGCRKPEAPTSGGGRPLSESDPGTCTTLRLVDETPTAPGNGRITFSLGQSNVDPCSVSGYVVGSQELKVEQAADGSFVIPNVPAGQHDVILQGQARKERIDDPSSRDAEEIAGSNLAVEAAAAYGLRLNELAVTPDTTTRLPDTTILLAVGSVEGSATLEGQTAHNGILVSIPGTHYSAFTADDGAFAIPGVVPGTHDFDYSKDQFHSARIGAAIVDEAARTTLPPVVLRLNRGESEGLVPSDADRDGSFDLTFEYSIVPSGAPVKLKTGFEADCPNKTWQPFVSNGSIALPETEAIRKGGYDTFDVYVCIADRDNTASTIKHTVTVDVFGNHGEVDFTPAYATLTRNYEPKIPLSVPASRLSQGFVRSFVTRSLASESAALANPGSYGRVDAPLAQNVTVTLPTGNEDCGDFWIYASLVNDAGYESRVKRLPVSIECWQSMNVDGRPKDAGSRAGVKWTGDRLVIFGDQYYKSARMFVPSTSTWQNVAATGRPEVARDYPKMIWVGDRLLVFGGESGDGPLWSGAFYRPDTDTWTALTGDASAVSADREDHSVYWAGDRLLVYGGQSIDSGDPLDSGALYFPATGRWLPMPATNAPGPRKDAAVIWTGRHLIVWGGSYDGERDNQYLGTGAIYDPVLNLWTAIETTGAPSPRGEPAATWTGDRLVIIGGYGPTGHHSLDYLQNGAAYDPLTRTWTPVATPPAAGYGFDVQQSAANQIVLSDGYGWQIGPMRLDLRSGLPGTWHSLVPDGCDEFPDGLRSVVTSKSLIFWPPLCGTRLTAYDLTTDLWRTMPDGGPVPYRNWTRRYVDAVRNRLVVYETPAYTEDEAAAALGVLRRNPLNFAWVRPADRVGSGLRPGETVGLAYRVVNDLLPVAGGVVTIKSITGPATIAKSTATLPALASRATADVPATESVSITASTNARPSDRIVITLSYETSEGYAGEAEFELPILRPWLAAAATGGYHALPLGAIGASVEYTLSNTGTEPLSDVVLTATPGSCLQSLQSTSLPPLEPGQAVVRNLAVNVAGTCPGGQAIANFAVTYKDGAGNPLTQTVLAGFPLGSFSETQTNATPASIPDDDPGALVTPLTFVRSGRVTRRNGEDGIKLTVRFTHQDLWDLYVWLESPNGTVVLLPYLPQESATGRDFTWTFADVPEFAAFLTQPVAGVWKVRVEDASPGDTGTVDAVELVIDGLP